MKRLRELASRQRTAVAIIAVAVAAFAVWKAYLVVSSSVRPTPAAAVRPASPAAGAALRAAGHLTGAAAPTLPDSSASSGAGGTDAASTDRNPSGRVTAPAASATAALASTPPPPNTGRPDPFSPLVTGGGSAPASPPSLPPVPPLSPNAIAAPAGTQGQPNSAGGFQLTGIIDGATAVAILNDGANSYIVERGDAVTSGVRITAIDAGNRSVTLASQNQSWQLRLGGGTSR